MIQKSNKLLIPLSQRTLLIAKKVNRLLIIVKGYVTAAKMKERENSKNDLLEIKALPFSKLCYYVVKSLFGFRK